MFLLISINFYFWVRGVSEIWHLEDKGSLFHYLASAYFTFLCYFNKAVALWSPPVCITISWEGCQVHGSRSRTLNRRLMLRLR